VERTNRERIDRLGRGEQATDAGLAVNGDTDRFAQFRGVAQGRSRNHWCNVAVVACRHNDQQVELESHVVQKSR
jgi:hypothetical protein